MKKLLLFALLLMVVFCMTGCYNEPKYTPANPNSGYVGNTPSGGFADAPTPFSSPTLPPVTTPKPYVAPSDPVLNLPTPNGNINGNGGLIIPNNSHTTVNPSATFTTVSPSQTPTFTVLKEGVSGDAVRDLQNKLKALGFLNGSADGDFGETTKAAVMAFQSAHKLLPDGIAGVATLDTLMNSKTTATPEPTPFILKKGAKGPEVTVLQKRLKALGYLSGSSDGDFGEVTHDAVVQFQKVNGLSADGVAGTQTLNVLNSSRAKHQNQTGTSSSGNHNTYATAKPSVHEKVYLKLGSTGDAVRQMQNRLIALGYLSGKATGVFDQATDEGVRAFQYRNMPYTDGIAGSGTLNKLYSSSAKSTSKSAASIGLSLEEGVENSSSVEKLQRRLRELGYYFGHSDGDYGSATTAAVKAFQRRNGLTVDGKAGSATLGKLYSSDALRPAPKATPKPTAKPTSDEDFKKPDDYVNVTPGPPGSDYVTLRLGNSGQLVKNLQEKLHEKGYYYGYVDGKYGVSTAKAIKYFQKNKGLTQDGVAGPATQRVLFQGNFPAES